LDKTKLCDLNSLYGQNYCHYLKCAAEANNMKAEMSHIANTAGNFRQVT